VSSKGQIDKIRKNHHGRGHEDPTLEIGSGQHWQPGILATFARKIHFLPLGFILTISPILAHPLFAQAGLPRMMDSNKDGWDDLWSLIYSHSYDGRSFFEDLQKTPMVTRMEMV
jgi:hypothetical protein